MCSSVKFDSGGDHVFRGGSGRGSLGGGGTHTGDRGA